MAIERPEAMVLRGRRQLDIASCSMGLAAFDLYRQEMERADIINIHFPWPFADLVHLASQRNKPLVITYHSDIVRQRWLNNLYAPLRNWLLRQADVIVATSQNYFESSPILRRFNEKVSVIPLGLDGSTVAPPNTTARQWVEANFPSDFFLFVGVLRYYKGLHYLIDAARSAPYPIIIAGSGPAEAELRARIAQLGIDNVMLTGQISDAQKAALMERCRAVVFPSHLRAEAFGITLVEGAMHGKALLSTELGTGTSFVNLDGHTGLVVPPADPAALRAAMDRLWSSPAESVVMGINARRRYEQQFSGQKLGERYRDLYHRIAADGVTSSNIAPG